MTKRERLVRDHMHLVRQIAGRIYRTSGIRSVPLDDLIGHGHIGLLQAADRYDGRDGVPFRNFADRRIEGAIIDGIRVQGPHTRKRILAVRAGAEPVTMVDERHAHKVPAPRPEPRDPILQRMLSEGLATLSARERTVMRLYYVDGRTLFEIGRQLRITESMVCRIHKGAIRSLREWMRS